MAYDILWRVHAILMSTSFLSLFSGILISLFYKKKPWRYKTHKNLGLIAGISGVTALLTALIMVGIYSGVHFTSLHGILGGFAAALLIATPLVGLSLRKAKNKKRSKTIHRTMGYITAATMVVVIIMGLLFTGILSFPG